MANVDKQFQVLSAEELMDVNGGRYTAEDCRNAMIVGISGAAITGFQMGLPALGVGGIAGAFVGAHIGAIGGGLTCLGGFGWDALFG